MEEISKYLDQDEKVLWSCVNHLNLLKKYPIYVAILIPSSFLMAFLYLGIIAFQAGNQIIGYFLLLTFFILESILITANFWITFQDKKNKISITKKGREELKSYNRIDVITSKRIIKKDCDWVHTLRKNLIILPKSVTLNNDIIFLDLEGIDGVVVNFQHKEIGIFTLEDKDHFILFFDFEKLKDLFHSEMLKTIKIIEELLSLVKEIEDPNVIVYIRRKI